MTEVLDWDIITPHYPPQDGGIADYTFALAAALAAQGDSVRIWSPRVHGDTSTVAGVCVRQVFANFNPHELVQLDRVWGESPKKSRRIVVMYHPHGFGWRSLNVPFCAWMWKRATRNHDRIIMIMHEYAVPFTPLNHLPFALTHRLMLSIALQSCAHVFCPVGAWIKSGRLLAFGRQPEIEWLPVYSNIPAGAERSEIFKARTQFAKSSEFLIGHFGTCPRDLVRSLDRLIPSLLRGQNNRKFLLMGLGTDRYVEELAKSQPDVAPRVYGVGALSAPALSIHLQACDLLLQPYPDGVSGRRGTAMAALANGVPLLTVRGKLTERCWNEVAGVYLTPASHLESVPSEIQTLLEAPAVRQGLSTRMRMYYEKHFAIEHTVCRLRSLELPPVLQDRGVC